MQPDCTELPGLHGTSLASSHPTKLLLSLDACPQHVLSLDHIWMLLNELPVMRQYELPAFVDPHYGHVLQQVLYILCTELRGGAE